MNFINSGTIGATPAMVINTSGNAGIGNTAPNTRLDVVSGTANTAGDSLSTPTASVTGPNVVMNGTVSNGTFAIATNDALGADIGGSLAFGGRYSTTQQANFAMIKGAKENGTSGAFGGYLVFGTRANGTQLSEKMRIDPSGNVGINTTAARSFLEVLGSGTANSGGDNVAQVTIVGANQTFGTNTGNLTLQTNDALAADMGGSIAFGARYNGAANAATFAMIKSGKTNATSGNLSGYLAFSTRDNAGGETEKMRIDNTGNVGIGTTTPLTKLEIVSGKLQVNASTSLGSAGSGDINAYNGTGASVELYDNNNSISIHSVPNAGNSDIAFDIGASTERMRIMSGGNVGIGTTAPDALLTLNKNTGTLPAAITGTIAHIGLSAISRG
jgi:trimeric autotransporter adhesin